MKHIALCLSALAFSASAASAALIDNPVDPNWGNETTAWVQSSGFSVDEDSLISGGTVSIGGFGNISAWDGTFNYFIFSDDGGAPGAIAASGSDASVSATDTGLAWAGGGNVFSLSFDLEGDFLAEAGADYWFGIHLSTDFSRDDIYWVTSTVQGETAESAGGSFDNWRVYSPSRAFTLEGAPVPAVPLPAGGLLLLTGLGAAVAFRKRAA